MNTAIKHLSLLATLLVTAWTHAATADVRHSVGVARSDINGSLQYIEHHQYFDDGSHRVEYYAPSMDVIAWKKLTYPALPQHPRIEQANLQKETKTLVEPLEDRIRMVRKSGGDSEEMFVERAPDVVCDAGFDTYIKSQWNNLVESDTTKIRFAIAGRSSTLGMKVETVPTGEPTTTGFRISPSNWFVGMFLPAIELVYRNEDRMLMRYKGFSNLSAADRNERIVTIDFAHYVTDNRLDQPLTQWLPEEAGNQVAAAP